MKSEYIVIILNNINVNPEYIDIGQNIHSKKCWVVLTQFWVKYGQTQNAGLKM